MVQIRKLEPGDVGPLVAWRGGDAFLDPQLGDGTTTAHLQALEVRPTYRRQGIASRLIQRVESEALARGVRRVTLMVEPDNRPAIQLYEALGYSFFKASTDIWRGKEYPVQCLGKVLAW